MPVKKSKVKIEKSKVQVETQKLDKKTERKSGLSPRSRTKSQTSRSLSTDVYDIKGKVVEKVSLPPEIFNAKVNPALMAQAVRVYLANKRQGNASTKTRGEVRGSTRKIYRQKGTGRARHGGIRAPIFVGGGITFGPKPRDFSLSFPKKMRRKALFSALTSKLEEGQIKIIAGLTKLQPKTKEMVKVFDKLGVEVNHKNVLFVKSKPEDSENAQRAAQNIKGVRLIGADQLNTYDVLNTTAILFMKESLDVLEKTYLKK